MTNLNNYYDPMDPSYLYPFSVAAGEGLSYGGITSFGTPAATPTPTTAAPPRAPASYSMTPTLGPSLASISGSPSAGFSQSMAERANQQLQTWDGRNAFGKMMYNQDGTFNWDAVGNITKAIGGFGQLYLGLQANKMAKQQLALSRESYEKNMANTIASYNMALEDRAYSRQAQYGSTRASADEYINKHKL